MEEKEQYKLKQLKIICLTPKGKAKKSLANMKQNILGITKCESIDQERIVSDKKFWFTYTPKNQKEYDKVLINSSKANVTIKKFYSVLISILTRLNKLANKSKWGLQKMKRWLVKRLIKLYKNDKENDFVKDIENQSDEEFKKMIKVEDIEEMQELMKKQLIKVEIVK